MTVLKKELLKKAPALKEKLLLESNSCDTLKKVTLKKCKEVTFAKRKLSGNIATYARRKAAIDPDRHSLGISYEYLTGWP